MSTIMKPPFPAIFTKKPLEKAKTATTLGPFMHMSSHGFAQKTPGMMKATVPFANTLSVHQADLERKEWNNSFAGLALLSAMPVEKPEEVEGAVSVVEEAVSKLKQQFLKKLKKNKKLEKDVVLDDGYSMDPFSHHKKKETTETELECPILPAAVVPRKPRLTPSPAFFPEPPPRYHHNGPPRGLHAFEIVMRWPVTSFLRMGMFPMQPFPTWFCVHFLKPLNQSNPSRELVPSDEYIKDLLVKLGLYSTMCKFWPAFGEEECVFWSRMYQMHGANSDLSPGDYFVAGSSSPCLAPGVYTKSDFEDAYDYKVEITVQKFGDSFLVEEFTIPLDHHLDVCPGKVRFREKIPPEASIEIPRFEGF